MTVYPLDSSAKAVILQDVGDARCWLSSREQDEIEFTRRRRIKIFDIAALDQGNLFIPYRFYNEAERFEDLDIQLFHTDGSKETVKSNNIFTEKLSKYTKAKKVFIPNLRKGDIIEYRYTLKTQNVPTLASWYFQHELPVRWSEITVTYPDFFDYVYLSNSETPFDVREATTEINRTFEQQSYTANVVRMGRAWLPAIKQEPFITTLDNYQSNIQFQLRSYQFPGDKKRMFMESWSAIAKSLEEEDHFGGQYLRPGQFSDLWSNFQPLIKPGDNAMEIAKKARQFVSSNIHWNGEFDLIARQKLNTAYEKKQGNSAECNLAVVALLRKAGLDAYPIVLSTRENGLMRSDYPFLSQFNNVIAFVRLDSTGIILDATHPNIPVNFLPSACYNGGGRVVDRAQPDWVDFIAPEYNETWYGNLKLDETGVMSGRFTMMANGLIAADWRSAISEKGARTFLKEHFAPSHEGVETDSIEVVSQDESPTQPLEIKFFSKTPGVADNINDFIYCRPILDFIITENHLKSVSRNFPVDFTCPVKSQYVLNLLLPEGYSAEELPQPAVISLSNNAGKLTFRCSKLSEREVQVILKLQLNQIHFEKEEYEHLRKFFILLEEKVQTQLVFKKQ